MFILRFLFNTVYKMSSMSPSGACQRVPVSVLNDTGPTNTNFLWSPARFYVSENDAGTEMDVLWPLAALLQAEVKLEPAGTTETIGRRGVRECSNPCPTPTLTSPPAGHCLGVKASWHSDQQHCSYQASFPAKPV